MGLIPDTSDPEHLPSGTITMLFSDIEGSTALLGRLGEQYAEALDAQRRVLREAWRRWRGHEMGTEGDSFFVVFEAAVDAASAALEAQRQMREHAWPAGEHVRVRMGLHSGEPMIHAGGYVGMDVHRAARIAGATHGGQIVVSDMTRSLVGEGLGKTADFIDLGSHRLKDLPQPEHLFQLSLRPVETFPPLRSLGAVSNLPAEATPILGRERELEQLLSLMSSPEVRLLTLTGTGGCGKTRLAIALAAGMQRAVEEEVFFVPLADVVTADVMWATVAETLGLSGQWRERTHLLDHLRNRQAMLLLDNLEQLPEAASVVAELLAAAPRLRVVATSRRPLHVRSEREYAISPLALPVGDSLAEVATFGVVKLFCRHAESVRFGFELTESNASAVAEICRRLDGLPLAVELAASRSQLLSPRAMLARLDQALRLPSPAVDRPSRHQTLRDTIAWSYDLLSPRLQGVFCALGVFAGGCDLQALAAVATGSEDPLSDVAEIVDVSLASMNEGPGGEPRVVLLQTVAEFARDHLAATGQLTEIRLRHATYFLGLARDLEPRLSTGEQLSVGSHLQAEYANLRAALEWCLSLESGGPPDPSRARIGLRLAAVLAGMWLLKEPGPHGRLLVERALAMDGGQDSPERAGALVALAEAADERSSDAKDLLTQAIEICHRLGDKGGASQALADLGSWHFRRGELQAARARLEESSDLAREGSDSVRQALAVHVLGEIEAEDGGPMRAIQLFEQSRGLALGRGDEYWAVWEEHWIAVTLLRCGQVSEASVRLHHAMSKVMRLSDSLLANRPGTVYGGLRRSDV